MPVALWIWASGWYCSVPQQRGVIDNSLIAIAGVAGVLWSGAIIAYSIHHSYSSQIKIAVQLIQCSIVAR
jgi:hypothetical protein